MPSPLLINRFVELFGKFEPTRPLTPYLLKQLPDPVLRVRDAFPVVSAEWLGWFCATSAVIVVCCLAWHFCTWRPLKRLKKLSHQNPDRLFNDLLGHPSRYRCNQSPDETGGRETPLLYRIRGYFWGILRQSVEMGALPQLYAATATNMRDGAFYAPGGFLQRTGYPKQVRSSRRSYAETLAKQL